MVRCLPAVRYHQLLLQANPCKTLKEPCDEDLNWPCLLSNMSCNMIATLPEQELCQALQVQDPDRQTDSLRIPDTSQVLRHPRISADPRPRDLTNLETVNKQNAHLLIPHAPLSHAIVYHAIHMSPPCIRAKMRWLEDQDLD